MHPHDRLFLKLQSDAGGKNFMEELNPDSLEVVTLCGVGATIGETRSDISD